MGGCTSVDQNREDASHATSTPKLSISFINKHVGLIEKCKLYGNFDEFHVGNDIYKSSLIVIDLADDDITSLEKRISRKKNNVNECIISNINVSIVKAYTSQTTKLANVDILCNILPNGNLVSGIKSVIKNDNNNNSNAVVADNKEQYQLNDASLTSTNATLVILGATWGLKNVTSVIKSFISSEEINNKSINNTTMGTDGWAGHTKTLQVFWSYDYDYETTNAGPYNCYGTTVQENGSLTITQAGSTSANLLNNWSFASQGNLTIIGSLFGQTNATAHLGQGTTSLNVTASSASLGGINQGGISLSDTALSVLYSFHGRVDLCIAEEGKTMVINNPPPLTVLGAAFGGINVTPMMNKLNIADRISFGHGKNNFYDTYFGDPWFGHHKTLTIVYQYQGYLPKMLLFAENETINIYFDTANETAGNAAYGTPSTLNIIGASWSGNDVTSTVRAKITNNHGISLGSLDFTANSGTFNSLNGNELAIVYQYGGSETKVAACRENQQMVIKKSYDNHMHLSLNANGLFDANDTCYIKAANNNYLKLNLQSGNDDIDDKDNDSDSDSVTLSLASSTDNATKLKVSSVDGSIVTFQDNSNANISFTFMVCVMSNGHICLCNQDGSLVYSYSNDNNVSTIVTMANNCGVKTSRFCGFIIDWVSIAIQSSDESINPFPNLARKMASMNNNINENEYDPSENKVDNNGNNNTLFMSDAATVALDNVIFDMTGGVMIAFAGAYLTANTKAAVIELIEHNTVVKTASRTILDGLQEHALNVYELVMASMGILKEFYNNGMAWAFVKIMVGAAFWLVPELFAKLVAMAFPVAQEIMVSEMVAALASWALETGLDIGKFVVASGSS